MKISRYYLIGLLFLSFFSCRENENRQVNQIKNSPRKDTVNVRKQIKQPVAIDIVELKTLDSSFVYDIRYATTNNFVGKQMYPCPKCYVRPVVAKALLEIQKELKKQGLRLKLFDCYRPGKVQQALWNIKPDPRYVADPKKGSMHNRGAAVDVTIVDKNGKELDMGTTYDFFGKKAHHSYKKLSDTVIKNRLFLKNLMQKYDLEPITTEWWHYSYRKKDFPIEYKIWKCP